MPGKPALDKLNEAERQMYTISWAIADPSRLVIISLLANAPEGLAVGELAHYLRTERSAAGHHAGKLAEAGIVTCEAEGNYRVYRLVPYADNPIATLADHLRSFARTSAKKRY